MARQNFTSTVARQAWSTPANHRCCMPPARSVVQQDTSSVAPDAGQETLAEIRTRCAETIPGQDYYAGLQESGIHYGPFFQSIAQLWRSNGEVLAEVQVPDGPEADVSWPANSPGNARCRIAGFRGRDCGRSD